MREVENSKTDRITREGDKRNRSPPPKYIIRELALFRPEPTHTQRYGRVEAEVERYCGVAAARYYATSILAFISREGERAREREQFRANGRKRRRLEALCIDISCGRKLIRVDEFRVFSFSRAFSIPRCEVRRVKSRKG